MNNLVVKDMDVNLPYLTGIEATQMIRSSEIAPDKIVTVTSLSDIVRSKCFDTGTTDFFTKPMSVASIKDVVRKHYSLPNAD